MGEVYRARDTRLKRDVALKVLPEGFAQNPDYDMAPDGSRFIVVREQQRFRGSTQCLVTLNWFEELKQRVPVR